MRCVATWLRVALFCLVKTNRRSHSVKGNANADFRLFAILLSRIAHVLVVSLACPRAQWPAQQFRVSRSC